MEFITVTIATTYVFEPIEIPQEPAPTSCDDQQGDLLYSAALCWNFRQPYLTQGRSRERIWEKNEVEQTGKLELRKEEIPGNEGIEMSRTFIYMRRKRKSVCKRINVFTINLGHDAVLPKTESLY